MCLEWASFWYTHFISVKEQKKVCGEHVKKKKFLPLSLNHPNVTTGQKNILSNF